MENQELKWYQKPKGVIILLILFFPIGLYQMWKNELWSKSTRWIVTVLLVVIALGNAGKNNSSVSSSSDSSNYNESTSEDNSSFNTSAGPDVCDCINNASRAGTVYYDGVFAKECENYAKGLSETQKSKRISSAFNRGCLQ